MKLTQDRVVVSVRDTFLHMGEQVSAVVTNGLDVPIYAEDMKTDCSVVTLERQEGLEWKRISGCMMKRPTRTVQLQAGADREVVIDPSGASFRLQAIVSGIYRISFVYRLESEPDAEAFITHSALFTIAS